MYGNLASDGREANRTPGGDAPLISGGHHGDAVGRGTACGPSKKRRGSMASEEIGFEELRRLVVRHWKLIVSLAVLAGFVAFGTLALVSPAVYQATARLVVFPLAQAPAGESRAPELYRSLLESDSILQKTAEKLADEGHLQKGASLLLGRDLRSRTEIIDKAQGEGSVIVLTALATRPETAASIANTWAAVFIEESRSMLQSTASEAEALLDQQLSPTRDQLAELEGERSSLLEKYQEREEEATTFWNRKIAAAKREAARESTEFQIETRQLMDEALAKHFSNVFGGSDPGDPERPDAAREDGIRSKLLEIVSVRAELAKTPRVLSLEKSANDEALAEMILRDGNADGFDSTLISQEINPLYDHLAINALTLESGLKRVAGRLLADVSRALVELERIQLERSSNLSALLAESGLELRILRRRLSRALEDLARERSALLAELGRKISQVAELEASLSRRLNAAALSKLLEKVEVVSLAAPAVPRPIPEPRNIPIKTAAAMFLGSMLGLLIALFRSAV